MTNISADTARLVYGNMVNLYPSAFVLRWDKKEAFFEGSASISEGVNLALDFLTSKNILIENRAQAEDFLIADNSLIGHLYKVKEKVSEYFSNSSLKLAISSDYENINEPSTLYIEIGTTLSPAEANRALNMLNRNWLFASQDRELASLNFTLSFI